MSLPLRDLLAAILRALSRQFSRPSPTTLDSLRSDLSHETQSKFAAMSGLLCEWEEARYRAGDRRSFGGLLDALRPIYEKYGVLASGRFPDLLRLVRCLAWIRRLQGWTAGRRTDDPPKPEDLRRLRSALEELRGGTKDLAERLSRNHGFRLATIVEDAVRSVEKEGGSTAPIEFALDPAALGVWVSREDGERWRDLTGNIVRNAVQATREKEGPNPTAVEVRVEPTAAHDGIRLIVRDRGVGMSVEALEGMWRRGRGSHGDGRGQGLTEEKLDFIRSRGTLAVESAAGEGTSITIDVRERTIPVRPSAPWRRRPVQAAALLLFIGLLGTSAILRTESRAVAVDVHAGSTLRGIDARGDVVWRRDLGATILPNRPQGSVDKTRATLVDQEGRADRALVVTGSEAGPGKFLLVDMQGRTLWKRPIEWDTPARGGITNLTSDWQVVLPWPDESGPVFSAEVRNRNDGPVAIQFLDHDGDRFAAYHHHGHLKYHSCQDLDADGRDEIVLFGINNAVAPSVGLADCPVDTYVGCVVILEAGRADGQAFPYRTWDNVPPAEEEAYLLVPPLRCGVNAQVTFVDTGPNERGAFSLQFSVDDGRSWRTDASLMPDRFYIGSDTEASRLVASGENVSSRLLLVRDGTPIEIHVSDEGGIHDP